MYGGKTTLYDILGVSRDAKLTDIGRAYNKFRAEMNDETMPPDPRRAALMREAFEILYDPEKRAAYDQSLRAPKVLLGQATSRVTPLHAGVGLALVIIAAAAYFALRPKEPPPRQTRSMQEIATAASAAVARLNSVDISGQSTPLGLAFAIAEGVLVTSCHGISPGSELTVKFSPRIVAARVLTADDGSGLCKLAAGGVGSWPLGLTDDYPRPGDTVYTAKLNAFGEARLNPGTVKRVIPDPKGNVIETSIPIPPEGRGGPLIDAKGRVVAIASVALPDGKARYLVLPTSWVIESEQTGRPVAPKAAAPVPSEPATPDKVEAPAKKGPNISPERQERLEKAFRPPPTVPGDL
jgi:hypothetical protein